MYDGRYPTYRRDGAYGPYWDPTSTYGSWPKDAYRSSAPSAGWVSSYPPHFPERATRAALQGAATGATIGAMIGAARSLYAEGSATERASEVGRSALREAVRVGLATGLGSAVASSVPGGPLARGLAMIAVGAFVLAAEGASLEAEGPREGAPSPGEEP